ncbi:MAG: trigger factor [Lachnospiraceae bacterium]|nr:trigger factor [Lachnospiraceae bacterium]
MKKKLIVALLATAALTLTACGDKTEPEESATTSEVPVESNEAGETSQSTEDSFYTTDLDLSVEGEPEVTDPVIENDYVAIGDYSHLEIEKVEVQEVDEVQVDTEFNSYMAVFDKEVEVTDRDTLEKGDIADIDYVGKIDGVEFDGGSAQGDKLELGSNRFIEGFEEGLVGVKKGESKTLELTFPEDYDNEAYAGKAATFDVTVNGIYKVESPEITDEFVKENTDFESIEDYKQSIRNEMQASKENTAENTRRSAIWAELVKNAAVKKYNEEKVVDYILEYKNYMESALASTYNMTLDAYLSNSGMTQEDFKKSALSNALSMAKQQLFLDAIAEKEGLQATDEQFDQYVKDYMTSINYEDEEEFWNSFTENGYDLEEIKGTMRDNIAADNVMKYLQTIVTEK